MTSSTIYPTSFFRCGHIKEEEEGKKYGKIFIYARRNCRKINSLHGTIKYLPNKRRKSLFNESGHLKLNLLNVL